MPGKDPMKAGLTPPGIESIKNVLSKCGAVAQLGERLTGSQEVRGSIPRSSTTRRIKKTCFL
jgi:hypothetical protein